MSSTSLASRIFQLPELKETPSPLEVLGSIEALLSFNPLEICLTFPTSHGDFVRSLAELISKRFPKYQTHYYMRTLEGGLALKLCVKVPDDN